MKFEKFPFKIEKQFRLLGYDYSQNGYYFITICTKDHINYFGEIKNNNVIFNDIGKIANKFIYEISKKFNNVLVDNFAIMPNHIHLIIEIIKYHENVGTHCNAFLQNKMDFLSSKSSQTIPVVIRTYKSWIKHQCNLLNSKFQWQPRFHDRIIRNEKEYFTIKQYIKNNPKNWQKDKENKSDNTF